MSTDDEEREQGIDFGDLEDDLEETDYPLTAGEVVERYGDREIGHPNGTETVEGVLEPLAESDDETEYETPEEVRQAVLNMVGEEAVGTKGTTDRGVQSDDTEGESKSF